MKLHASSLLLSVISAFAMNTYADPSIVIDNDECVVAFETAGGPLVLYGDKVHAVAAVSGNVDTPLAPGTVHCQGTHAADLQRALILRAPCAVFGAPSPPFEDPLLTEDGMLAATPSGSWSAQCKFRKATGRQNKN